MNKKFLIADDHLVVRAGVAMILRQKYREVEIFHAERYSEVLNHVSRENFDLLILDINMPESKHRVMIRELKKLNPMLKILVFSAYEENIAIQYIMEGAEGYINKLCSEEEFYEAVNSIIEKGVYYPTKFVQKIINYSKTKTENPFDLLTEKEAIITKLLIAGNGNIEICNILNIHMSTVSTYKKKIFKKLGVPSLAELVKLHIENSSYINL